MAAPEVPTTADRSAARRRKVQVAAVLTVVLIAAVMAAIFFWTLSARLLVILAVGAFAVAVISGLMFATLQLEERMQPFRDVFEDAFADAAIWTVLIGVFLLGLTGYALYQASQRSHSSPPSTLLTNTAVDEPINSYIALGDSYSAGEGLGTKAAPYLPPTGDGGNRCHRSAQAYPELLSFPNATSPVPLVFVACSGAISAQVFELPQKTGYPVQGDALAPKADLVTLTMGGNDLHFSDVLKLCFLKSDCTNKVLSLSGISAGHGEDNTPTGLKLSVWADKMLPIIKQRLTTVLTRDPLPRTRCPHRDHRLPPPAAHRLGRQGRDRVPPGPEHGQGPGAGVHRRRPGSLQPGHLRGGGRQQRRVRRSRLRLDRPRGLREQGRLDQPGAGQRHQPRPRAASTRRRPARSRWPASSPATSTPTRRRRWTVRRRATCRLGPGSVDAPLSCSKTG